MSDNVTFIDGYRAIRRLPDNSQCRFNRYFSRQLKYRLQPLFADLSLVISIVGAIIFTITQANVLGGWNQLHPLLFVYTGILVVLLLLHRMTHIRWQSPVIVYLIFGNMALFGYLDFLVNGGGIKPLMGLFLFISSVGFLTFSLFHSSVIVVTQIVLLILATSLISETGRIIDNVLAVLSHWVAIISLLLAVLSAIFNYWLFRNIFGLQYMLKRSNRQLASTLRQLKSTEKQLIEQQKQQAISHLAAGLLHEVINPANCSIQAIRFAQNINKDEHLKEVLSDAIDNQERVIRVIEELKLFSESPKEQLKEEANISELLLDSIQLCRNELHDISITNHISEHLKIPCFPTAVVQIFVNLLSNSAKALLEKTTKDSLAIQIEQSVDIDSVTLSFRDNGVGIPTHIIDKITEPFYTSSDSSDNLGLGLNICQTIMRHHNGGLSITSKEHAWTEVRLTFPLR